MTLPKNVEAYEDVRLVLENALLNGGGTYVLGTLREAIDWRRRAYKYRALINKKGENKFNAMVLRIRDTSIVFDENRVSGTLLDPQGMPVELTDPVLDEFLKEDKEVIE